MAIEISHLVKQPKSAGCTPHTDYRLQIWKDVILQTFLSAVNTYFQFHLLGTTCVLSTSCLTELDLKLNNTSGYAPV